MSSALEDLKAKVEKQGNVVRQLKTDKADKAKVEAAVAELKTLKAQLADEEKKVAAAAPPMEEKKDKDTLRREAFDHLLRHKFFVVPSFEIYGGVAGLYDYGPPGVAIMNNIVNFWRQHFVLTENMLEVQCTALTPEIVLKTSGHVDKFTDFMVKDVKTGDCHRADKILEDRLEALLNAPEAAKLSDKERQQMMADRSRAGAMLQEELAAKLKEYKVVAPDTLNELGPPYPFNLMFQTHIGPSGKLIGYLRPETAQGIFVNFRRLLEYNGGRMPFAAAMIGSAFRNEIAPRAGLLRVREFQMAEIEHFVNPHDKRHPKFKRIAQLVVPLLPRELQTGEDIAAEMSLGDAVAKGVINSETLAYFLGRTYLFLTSIGVKKEKLRFRQHKSDEMAHYAKDCWDAEIKTFYGWVECVGHADRACYDLDKHSEKSKVDLSARESFDKPREVETAKKNIDRGAIGKKFGKGGAELIKHLAELETKEALSLSERLTKQGAQTIELCTGQSYTIEPAWFSAVSKMEIQATIKYMPSVIEPSFGLGRIIYCVLEHSFDNTAHADEARSVLHLPPLVAPFKVAILPLSGDPALEPMLESLLHKFVVNNLANKLDDSGASIGKKYARADELGVPFAITVDFQSLKDQTVTLRDRDTTQQVRVTVDQAVGIVRDMVQNTTTWTEVYDKFPRFLKQEIDSMEAKSLIKQAHESSSGAASAPAPAPAALAAPAAAAAAAVAPAAAASCKCGPGCKCTAAGQPCTCGQSEAKGGACKCGPGCKCTLSGEACKCGDRCCSGTASSSSNSNSWLLMAGALGVGFVVGVTLVKLLARTR